MTEVQSTSGSRLDRVADLRSPVSPRPQQNNHDDAVAYCEAGLAIYPLIPGTKIPAFASPHPRRSKERGRCRGECGRPGHGFYDARVDVGWASRYWTAHPDHGIAARPVPGQIVLDIDPRHGGDADLAELEGRYGPLPPTFTVISGRGDGGRHLWFSGVAGPVRGRLSLGIDIVSHSRGAVVMPPSLHPVSGEPYRFQRRLTDIADAPLWLREMVSRPEQEPIGRWSRSTRAMSPTGARRRGRGLIAAVAAASEGERHSTLYWAASRAAEDGLLAVDGGLDVDLADAARDAGLAPDEVERTITDAVLAVRAGGGR